MAFCVLTTLSVWRTSRLYTQRIYYYYEFSLLWLEHKVERIEDKGQHAYGALANLTNMSNFTLLRFWDVLKYKYKFNYLFLSIYAAAT